MDGTRSTSITIKKKQEPAKSNPTTNKQTNTNKKNQNKNTKATTTTTTTTKPKADEQQNKEEEDAHILGVYYIYIEAIKENGEKEQIKLDKEFNYNIYEYSCTVNKDVKKLEIQKEAYEYNDLVEITGTEELQYGENTVIIKVKNDDKEVEYKINVIKQEEEPKEENSEEKSEILEVKEKIISMPLIHFIILQLSIIIIEIIFCVIIVKAKNKKSK